MASEQEELENTVEEVEEELALEGLENVAAGFEDVAVAELGVNEMAEGLARLAVSDAMAMRSVEWAEAGLQLTAEGLVEAEIAQELREAAKKSAAEGIGEVAAGAAELGTAGTLDALIEEPEE